MLSPCALRAFVPEQLQVLADELARLARSNHTIHKPALRCDERVGKFVLIGQRVIVNLLASKDDLNSPLRSHDSDLGRWPCVIHVTAQVLRAHHVVSTTVGLARDDRDLVKTGARTRTKREQLSSLFGNFSS